MLPSAPLSPAGEINTLQGNLNWVASREHELSNPIWKGREAELTPLCNAAQSDSANLDNVAELLVRTGTDPQDALMLLVPEAYRNHPDLMKEYPEVRAEDWVGGAGRGGGESGERLGKCRSRGWSRSGAVGRVARAKGVTGGIDEGLGAPRIKWRCFKGPGRGPGQLGIVVISVRGLSTKGEYPHRWGV